MYDRILFIEDDDWYAPHYLRTVSGWLDRARIVGEGYARYYQLDLRKWRRMNNPKHASLSQTAIRGDLMEKLASLCVNPPDSFVDLRLWRDEPDHFILDDRGDKLKLHCSLKRLPGRKGIGNGHDTKLQMNDDRDWSILTGWVGGDVTVYQGLYESMKEGAA